MGLSVFSTFELVQLANFGNISFIYFEQTLYGFEDHIMEIITPLHFIKKDDRKPHLFWLKFAQKTCSTPGFSNKVR